MFFCRVYCQYRRFIPEDEEDGIEDPGALRSSRRPSRATSFKEFVDKKEAVVKEMLKRKSSDRKSSDNKRPGSQISDGQPNSPS